jgi:crotonobetainyl-CoA:carnitine CoA-transferase CaiB-like acyl-CoA transferase
MSMPLQGLKVIEAAQNAAGPMAGRWLADWGADVIHIEHPTRGDPVRSRFFRMYAGRDIESNFNYAWENIDRNKRSLTLDLAKPVGKEILRNLVEKADVFLTNYRTSDLIKFSCQYEDLERLNRRLIYASVTGYGDVGPDKDTPGFDVSAFFSRAGLLEAMRNPGQVPPPNVIALGDFITALGLTCGILAALNNRAVTGKGQEVKTSLYNMGVYAMSYDIAATLLLKQLMPPPPLVNELLAKQKGNRIDLREASLTPMVNYYETLDGRWISLALVQPMQYWPNLCRAIDRDDLIDDNRFNSFEGILMNRSELFRILDDSFRKKTLEEWRERMDQEGLVWALLQNCLEVINDPQARANDFFTAFNHPSHGPVEMVACPVKLSDTPAQIRMAAPEFGQHTEEVLLEFGYTWDDIARFKESGVIG